MPHIEIKVGVPRATIQLGRRRARELTPSRGVARLRCVAAVADEDAGTHDRCTASARWAFLVKLAPPATAGATGGERLIAVCRTHANKAERAGELEVFDA